MKNPRSFARGDGRRAVLAWFVGALAVALVACSAAGNPPSVTPPPATQLPVTQLPGTPPPGTPLPVTQLPATPTPSATPTPATAPTEIRVPPPITSVSRLTETALGYLTHLSEELGPRESATIQELAAAEYIAAQLERFGYSVETQSFTIQRLSPALSGLIIDAPETQILEAIPLLRTGTGEISGMVQPVGLAQEGDIPKEGLKGKIALVERGIIPFEQKVATSAKAGAVAVVIYNNRDGNFQGVLASAGTIPAVAISRQDGLSIERLLTQGPVTATVKVVEEALESRNVVAEKPGSPGDLGEAVVVLGGHYDTVPGISGANDNASGTAVLLTVAQELFEETLPFTVRFVAFGSEELGLLGSLHHLNSLTEDEKDHIWAMLNFDALGSGREVNVLGDRSLTSLALELGDELQIQVATNPGLQGGGSDHQSFSSVGIPVLMFFANDFSRIHTALDTLDSVSPSLLGESAAIAVALLRSQAFLDTLE